MFSLSKALEHGTNIKGTGSLAIVPSERVVLGPHQLNRSAGKNVATFRSCCVLAVVPGAWCYSCVGVFSHTALSVFHSVTFFIYLKEDTIGYAL